MPTSKRPSESVLQCLNNRKQLIIFVKFITYNYAWIPPKNSFIIIVQSKQYNWFCPLIGFAWCQSLHHANPMRGQNQLYCLEKAMAPYSSTLAWKIPWKEEPGGPQSTGSLGVRHDWTTSLSLFTSMHWRRKGQPTPVFLPGESQGRGSLVGCHLWGRTESDTTEAT